MKTVLLGGSFDPVHNGHMAVARAALAHGYDEVVFLPVALSPHKLGRPPAPAFDRFAMCILATIDAPEMSVSRLELERDPPSYSADTVGEFRKRRQADTFWWAIGADNLPALLTWMRIEEFARQARLLVLPREPVAGKALEGAIAALPGWLREAMDPLDMAPVAVSSTLVRARARAGEDLADLVPGDVARFVRRYGLYKSVDATFSGGKM